MEFAKINELITKYFDAETSLEEEVIIQAYFKNEEVHADLKKYSPLFQHIEQEQQFVLGDDFDETLMQTITEAPKQDSDSAAPGQSRRIKLLPMVMRIAAVVVLTAGMFWMVNDRVEAEQPECVTEACAEEAYEQAREALLFLSTKLKKGTDKTKQISKTETLSSIFKH